jgi:hypothetical protein
MKQILLIFLSIFSYALSYSQKAEYIHIIDSLRVKYKKNVVGFSKTVIMNPMCQETFRIFYTDNGKFQDEIVWSKEVLDNNKSHQIIIAGQPHTYELFVDSDTIKPKVKSQINNFKNSGILVFINTEYTYSPVGFIDGRKFIKLQPQQYREYSVQKWAEKIIENDDELVKLLKIKYGDYLTY